MDDLISRQAAIDAIYKCTDIYVNNLPVMIDKADAYKALADLPSAQPEDKCGECDAWNQYKNYPRQRWIPCSERLPEDYTDVLVWFEYFRYGSYNRMYQTYGIGTYSGQYEYDSWMINHETGWNNLRVIAWMPLPEPYDPDMRGEQDG